MADFLFQFSVVSFLLNITDINASGILLNTCCSFTTKLLKVKKLYQEIGHNFVNQMKKQYLELEQHSLPYIWTNTNNI